MKKQYTQKEQALILNPEQTTSNSFMSLFFNSNSELAKINSNGNISILEPFKYDDLQNIISLRDSNIKIGLGNIQPLVSLDLYGKTDAVFLPNGTTTERPSTSGNHANGFFRYNNETKKFEGYQNNTWQNFIDDDEYKDYYINDFTEFNDAYTSFYNNSDFKAARFYITGTVIFTADYTMKLDKPIEIYGLGGSIQFSTNSGTDNDNTLGHKIIIDTINSSTISKLSFFDIALHGSNCSTSVDMTNAKNRKIIQVGTSTSQETRVVYLIFTNITFCDIIGGVGFSGTQEGVIDYFAKNNWAYSLKFDKCNYFSHKNVDPSINPYDIEYNPFTIEHSYSGNNINDGIVVYVSNQQNPRDALNGSGSYYQFIGEEWSSSSKTIKVHFNGDYTSQLKDYVYSETSPPGTSVLQRTQQMKLIPEATSLLDSDYLFFNNSTNNNGTYDNIRKISKANLFINGSNISVGPDTAILFADGTSIAGETDFTYDKLTNLLTLNGTFNVDTIKLTPLTFSETTDDTPTILVRDSSSSELRYMETNTNWKISVNSTLPTSASNYNQIIGGYDLKINSHSYYNILLSGRGNKINNNDTSTNNYYNSILGGYQNIMLSDSYACNITGGYSNQINDGCDYSGIFVSYYGTINAGVDRSAIIAGSNLTATQSDTVYVPSLSTNRSVQHKTLSVTANLTLTDAHHIIFLDNTSAITISLPQASTCTGRVYVFKKGNNGNVASSVDPYGSETIDGNTSIILCNSYYSITIVSDGSNWKIIATVGTNKTCPL